MAKKMLNLVFPLNNNPIFSIFSDSLEIPKIGNFYKTDTSTKSLKKKKKKSPKKHHEF